MKNIAKFLLVVVIFTVCLGMVSCTGANYNARVLNYNRYSFNYEWHNNNLTRGDFNADPNADLPETRTFIITDQKTLDEIFTKFPKVDFEKETVLIYCYTDVYPDKSLVEEVTLSGDTLMVKLGTASGIFDSFVFGASVSLTRFCVIKLDKVEAKNINIVF
jgi:hypothetical protein